MLKVIFAGTPSFTIPVLDALISNSRLVGAITPPAKRQGRSMKIKDSSLASYVRALKTDGTLQESFPIFEKESIDEDLMEKVASLDADLLVCFAYGKIFPAKFISLFKRGGINIHPSLLPKWRGASPIPSAMYAGDFRTGVSIQTIKQKMDCGDILLQRSFTIEKGESADEVLSDKVAKLSAQMVKDVLEDFEAKLKGATPQNEAEASYSHLLKKCDGLIDWQRSATEIEWQINAFNSWPGTYTFCNGKKLNIIEGHALLEKEAPCGVAPGTVLGKDEKEGILVLTGSGILCVTKLQWETKKVLGWKDFLNGAHLFLGSRLSSE